METKTQTHKEVMQEKADRLKALIIERLEITELDYCQFQFEFGLAYLKAYKPDDNGEVRYNKLFWNWWKNHWSQTDELFKMCLINRNFNLSSARALYTSFHDPLIMAKEIRPHISLFENSVNELQKQPSQCQKY